MSDYLKRGRRFENGENPIFILLILKSKKKMLASKKKHNYFIIEHRARELRDPRVELRFHKSRSH